MPASALVVERPKIGTSRVRMTPARAPGSMLPDRRMARACARWWSGGCRGVPGYARPVPVMIAARTARKLRSLFSGLPAAGGAEGCSRLNGELRQACPEVPRWITAPEHGAARGAYHQPHRRRFDARQHSPRCRGLTRRRCPAEAGLPGGGLATGGVSFHWKASEAPSCRRCLAGFARPGRLVDMPGAAARVSTPDGQSTQMPVRRPARVIQLLDVCVVVVHEGAARALMPGGRHPPIEMKQPPVPVSWRWPYPADPEAETRHVVRAGALRTAAAMSIASRREMNSRLDAACTFTDWRWV